MWIYLFRWAKNMKILVLHANVYQKVTLAEEELSKQVGRMIHSVDIHLFPKPSLSFSNGFMNKKGHGILMEIMHGLNNVDFTH